MREPMLFRSSWSLLISMKGLAKALKQKGIGDLERALQQLHTLGADRRAPSSDGQQHPDARAILFDKLKLTRGASSSCVLLLVGWSGVLPSCLHCPPKNLLLTY